MDRPPKSNPSLPSEFVTLADLRERWLKQKELELKEKERQLEVKEKEIQKQNQQRHLDPEETKLWKQHQQRQREPNEKEIQKHHYQNQQQQPVELRPQPRHRQGGQSEIQPNRRSLGSGHHEVKPVTGVGSLSRGSDKKEESSEVETEIGVGDVGNKEEQKKKKKKNKSKKKYRVRKGMSKDKPNPRSLDTEAASEGSSQPPLEGKVEMKEEEDIEACAKLENVGTKSEFGGERSKNFVKVAQMKIGNLSLNDRRDSRFWRPYDGFRRFRGSYYERFVRSNLPKSMIWVRKDGLSNQNADGIGNASFS